MKLLLDTHVWLWSHLEPSKLGKKATAALTADSNELWLSPISLWEVLLLIERGRISVQGSPDEWITDTLQAAPMHEATLNHEVARRSRTVRVAREDPADRFLAATAAVYDLTLVTADGHLLQGRGFRTLPADR